MYCNHSACIDYEQCECREGNLGVGKKLLPYGAAAAAAAAATSLQSCLTLLPDRRQTTRLLCPWDSPGKNTGVGYGADSVPPFAPYHSGLSITLKVGFPGKVALIRVLLSG